MNRILLACVFVVISTISHGQETTIRQLQEQNLVLLSREDLQALLPGARVVRHTGHGSTHRWTNELSGRFVASTDPTGSRANGTWEIDDRGRYCLDIEWSTGRQRWCRYVFKAGDKYFVANNQKPDTKAFQMSFSR